MTLAIILLLLYLYFRGAAVLTLIVVPAVYLAPETARDRVGAEARG